MTEYELQAGHWNVSLSHVIQDGEIDAAMDFPIVDVRGGNSKIKLHTSYPDHIRADDPFRVGLRANTFLEMSLSGTLLAKEDSPYGSLYTVRYKP